MSFRKVECVIVSKDTAEVDRNELVDEGYEFVGWAKDGGYIFILE